jgi:hypothetical protein
MNSRKVQLMLVVLGATGLSVTAIDRPAQAQSASPAYYAAQLGGGSLAALAGGLAGTLAGGLSGALLGVTAELLTDPFSFYQELEQESEGLPRIRSVDWAFLGAKIGFGLGVGVGAAVGVISVGAAFEIAGDPQGAMLGALTGSLVGMVLLLDSVRPYFQWRWIRTAEGWRGRSEFTMHKLLLNPVTLAALGATISYNLGKKDWVAKVPISVPLFALRF